MLAKVHCSAVHGIIAHALEVEVNDGYCETLKVIVGLPEAAVRESCNRIIKVSRTITDLAGADEINQQTPLRDAPITHPRPPTLGLI